MTHSGANGSFTMSIYSLRLIFASLLALTAFSVRAAEPPRLSPEQKVLDRFLGTWRVTYTIAKAEWNPEEKKGTADDTYTRILAGSFVQCKGEQSDKASNLVMYTYDADRKCYRAW